MPHIIKGCLQPIISRVYKPGTARRPGGQRVIITLACGHSDERRASSVFPNAKKAQCWKCVDSKEKAPPPF